MKFNFRGIFLLLFFLFFVLGGLSRFLTFEYFSNAFPFAVKWFVVPCLLLGFYYSYYCVFKIGPKQANSGKVIGVIALGGFATLIFLKSVEGYLHEWNASGKGETGFMLNGHVSAIDAPKKKNRLFSLYSVEIKTSTGETISLDTKNTTHRIGHQFNMNMKKGRLGFIYLRKTTL